MRAKWRAEGKFYEFTGYTEEGVGHPVTITVLADRITKTPGSVGTVAPEPAEGVTRLPVRRSRDEVVALRDVEGVEVAKASVMQARITVKAPPAALSFHCLASVADQVRNDLSAGISEAMIAAARRAVPETPVAAVAGLLAADDVAERIEQLADLRDRGLITEPEFEAKKRQLLGL